MLGAWAAGVAAADAECSMLRDAIRNIRLIIHSQSPDDAKLSAVAGVADELGPPPTPRESGAVALAALLAWNDGPATLMLEQLAGGDVHMALARMEARELTPAECRDLHTPAGTRGYERRGVLRTGPGVTIARVRSVVVTGRLPALTLGRLAAAVNGSPRPSEPLGTVLASLPGARREPLYARVTARPDVAVESGARMWANGQPVALASEEITDDFCAIARVPESAPA